MEFLEYNAEGSVAVQPAWTHCQHSVANICKLEHVGVSNREKLYRQMCQAVLHSKPKEQAFDFSSQRVPFEIVRMAGDGRCGWRALLASMDIAAFREVPRTGFQVSKYIYIYMYVYVYTHLVSRNATKSVQKAGTAPNKRLFRILIYWALVRHAFWKAHCQEPGALPRECGSEQAGGSRGQGSLLRSLWLAMN
jgi:hypothetical protein